MIIIKTYRRTLVLAAIIKILSDLSSLVGPLSISCVLNYISDAQHRTAVNSTTLPVHTILSNGQVTGQFLTWNQYFSNAYVMCVVVLVATLIQSTLSNNFNHLVISEGIHLKTSLDSLIFQKVLKMPVSNSKGTDVGVISNYMSMDSSNIFQFFTMKHYLWMVPIKIAILLYLLYQQMGVSALIGASLFIVVAPFQYYCSRQISVNQRAQMNVADQRLSKTNELFIGIKLLKLLGWNVKFATRITKLRELELKHLRKDAIFVALNTFITQGSAILVTLITFNLYSYIEKAPLTAARVFTSIALFNQITVPLYIVPVVIPMMISAINSHKRLVDFFLSSEVNDKVFEWKTRLESMRTEESLHNKPKLYDSRDMTSDHQPKSAPISSDDGNEAKCLPINLEQIKRKTFSGSLEDVALGFSQIHANEVAAQKRKLVLDRSNSTASGERSRMKCGNKCLIALCCEIKDGKFAWFDEANKTDATLYDINIEIPRNKLTIISGSVGGGKSSLLGSLIGETQLLQGRVTWLHENSFAFGYVPSSPWILNVSVQENITFGRVFDRKRYDEVVKACCLQVDIDLLPFGDQTTIGERGINLSGGQRQRIALARALYSHAATLILDDALSSLDPIVGYSVFENAILRLAIRVQRRTVILATHKHEFLSHADYVIAIECGSIKNQGTLCQIEKADKAFFYHWNVIKDKEIHERRHQRPRTCKTFEERSRLVRILSKKGEFRGPILRRDYHNNSIKYKRNPKFLSRQMSYDTSNALPIHDWVEYEETIPETEMELSPSSLTTSNNFAIYDNGQTLKQSFHSLNSANSMTDSLTDSVSTNQPSRSAPTFLRLNSRISNYSTAAANSIIEEEDDQEEDTFEEADQLGLDVELDGDDPCCDTNSQGSIQDQTNEVTNELICEITSYNENQVETETLYNSATANLLLGDDKQASSSNPRNNQIPLHVHLYYYKAHGFGLATLVLFLIILNQTFRIVSDFWLANWTNNDEKRVFFSNGTSLPSGYRPENVQYYINIYTILSVVSVFVSLATNLTAQLIALRAIRMFHEQLLCRLVRAPLLFFDKTPIGRIMNRFTNDIDVIDKVRISFCLYSLSFASFLSSETSDRHSCFVEILISMFVRHRGEHNHHSILHSGHCAHSRGVLLFANDIPVQHATIAATRVGQQIADTVAL